MKLVVFANGCCLPFLVSMKIIMQDYISVSMKHICHLNGFKDGDDGYDKAQKLSTMLGKLVTEYKQQAHVYNQTLDECLMNV